MEHTNVTAKPTAGMIHPMDNLALLLLRLATLMSALVPKLQATFAFPMSMGVIHAAVGNLGGLVLRTSSFACILT